MEERKNSGSFMMKVAGFIVDKRNLFFLLTVIGIIFSMFSQSWVEVENDLAAYLPDDSETRQGLDIMEEQFTTYGTARIMAANVTLSEAEKIADLLKDIKGVQSVAFDDTRDHYNNVSALYDVTFDYDENDDECLNSLDRVKEALEDYDIYTSTALGNTQAETIDVEVRVIMVLVAIIVVIVLIFTSRTYAEIPVLLLTFVTAMILNTGTNFLMGKISFVSNSVTSILQLALSLDYAV
ncbi:MAG: RND transporter, partial [Eubacteriales bacterium]